MSRVLVTGAGGSIGSHLTKKLVDLGNEVTGLDISECNLFWLERDLGKSFNPILGDFRNNRFVEWLFSNNQFDHVFHAGAYKHVPILQKCPVEGILNNTIATKTLIDEARRHGAKSFTFISTDKSADPTTFLGRTKRISELIVKENNSPTMETCSVRFCNVMNSSGSVLPLFKSQMERGHPITVTDFTMDRFFNTIEESVNFIMKTLAISDRRGDVFVYENYRKVKIKELADCLKMYSEYFLEKEIKVIEVGNRGNEKISEVLSSVKETLINTEYNDIKRIEVNVPHTKFRMYLDDLEKHCRNYDHVRAVETLDLFASEV